MARYGVKLEQSNPLLIGNEISCRNLGEADAKAREIAKENPCKTVKIYKYSQGKRGFCANGVLYKKICFGWPDEKESR